MAMIRHIIRGALTYVPPIENRLAKRTGGTVSARYCYSVWLRHLIMAHHSGLPTRPEVVAELGPGDSLGIGLAALLSGCERYYGFDVVEYADAGTNRAILEELIALFQAREDVPGEQEFPDVKPYLPSYEFPSHLLDDEHLGRQLRPDRLEAIRRSLAATARGDAGDSLITYVAPWFDPKALVKSSVDMIYSQAVLEHVADLRTTYAAMRRWLKPTGFLSHEIGLTSHGLAKDWNGHWAYSDLVWRLIQGRRPYLLNREPCSTHLRMLEEAGFRVVLEKRVRDSGGIGRTSLARTFRDMGDDDLRTRAAFVQAVIQS